MLSFVCKLVFVKGNSKSANSNSNFEWALF